MIDGTYNVMLKTTMGVKKGELIFSGEDSVLTGKLVVMGNDNLFETISLDGNNFKCTGSVEGDNIEGVAKTKKGNMSLSGKRK